MTFGGRRDGSTAGPASILAWATLLAFATLPACGGAKSADGAQAADAGEQANEAGSIGETVEDSALAGTDVVQDAAADETDGHADEASVDAADESTSDAAGDAAASCAFPPDPQAGQAGAPCVVKTDCDSGFCIPGPAGNVCAMQCQACCPSGYACEPSGTGPDSTNICIFKQLSLCQPCNLDAQCSGSKGGLCVPYGTSGSFCGTSCGADSDCPDSFKCEKASGEKGSGKQCVRIGAACSCSTDAIAAGAKTSCSNVNGLGTCTGERTCTIGGLSACSAATPAAEVCNGKDDNCDGVTDEFNAGGCSPFWPDSDGDGFGDVSASSVCACAPSGLATSGTNSDCDDSEKSIHLGASESCNGKDDNCDGVTDEGCDGDGDGWCALGLIVTGGKCKAGDCNDGNASIHPAGKEICGNGSDDDCDGATDSGTGATGCANFYADSDGDGWGAGTGTCLCAAADVFTTAKNGDCNDGDQNIHPDGSEVCGNSIDDDCNGQTDEAGGKGCTNFYVDLDGDGWGGATPTCLCAASGEWSVSSGGDCNDGNGDIHPSASESCNGVDDNCDGSTDEAGANGCSTWFVDGDGDGYGSDGSAKCLCAGAVGLSQAGSDCNDNSAKAFPGGKEICDGIDNDCDGATDLNASDCTVYFLDSDGDNYGDSGVSGCFCAPIGNFKAVAGGDCADGNAAIHPGATEICDGIDNDCANGTDDNGALGCTSYWRDHDGDGYGVTADSLCLCASTGEYTATASGDCNDDDSGVHPTASESCNGVDDNCDGATDPANADGCTPWYLDKDGDSYGSFLSASKCLCTGVSGYASTGGDCNDGDSGVHPGATEVCNGKDDDCDGSKDPLDTQGCVNWYVDGDNDGYGQSKLFECLCQGEGIFSTNVGGDCNDGVTAIHPGAFESCNNVDDNCDGSTDEGVIFTYFHDGDTDGYGSGAGSLLCAPNATFSSLFSTDCDDGNSNIHPGASEMCNKLDDDCNGVTDDNLASAPYYSDGDGDGYGVGAGVFQCGPIGKVSATNDGDCNDSASGIHPNATEVCNGIDDNCDGSTDEGLGASVWFLDSDGDGYGHGSGVTACAPGSGYTTTIDGDCNDGASDVHPGALEGCNGVDDNCDGVTDEGMPTTTYFTDGDLDGYGASGSGLVQCGPYGGHTVALGGDCNDGASGVHPGVSEICNSIDDNCDSQTDEGLGTHTLYKDVDGDTYGDNATAIVTCANPSGYVGTGGDCNDAKAGVHPGATEACNGVDDNCSGVTDEGCGGCVPKTIMDFEDGQTTNWTFSYSDGGTSKPKWRNYSPGFSGSRSLELSDTATAHGYSMSKSTSVDYIAVGSVLVPAGSKQVVMSLAYYPVTYVSIICLLYGPPCHVIDDVASIAIKLNGVNGSPVPSYVPWDPTPGTPDYTQCHNWTITWQLNTPPTIDTVMTMTVDFKTGTAGAQDAASKYGYVGIDDVGVTCN